MGFWRADGSLFAPSEALARLLGCTRQDMDSGKIRWSDITPSEYAPLDANALDQIRTIGECAPFEKEYIRSDGTRIPVLVGGAAFGDGIADAGCFFAVDLRLRQTGLPLYSREVLSRIPGFPRALDIEGARVRVALLTPRERQIAEMLARGDSCKQIARRLEIAHKTVDHHRAAILEKVGVDNPTQLAHVLGVIR